MRSLRRCKVPVYVDAKSAKLPAQMISHFTSEFKSQGNLSGARLPYAVNCHFVVDFA